MREEEFMARVRKWRTSHPSPEAAYIAAIPKHVADSMAFEGDQVDIEFLKENLDSL